MRLPQIRLESSPAKIEINTTPAEQSIEQPQAVLDLQQPSAEWHIERTPSKLTIDQSQAWADMDLKPISRRIAEFAQNGYQDCLDGMARRAQDGDELMRIENGGNPIASISERNSQRSQHDFNIGFIPSPFSVKINYEPSRLNIQWDIKKPINNTHESKPIINYKPGLVETKLSQSPSMKVDFVDLKFIGQKYEQEI